MVQRDGGPGWVEPQSTRTRPVLHDDGLVQAALARHGRRCEAAHYARLGIPRSNLSARARCCSFLARAERTVSITPPPACTAPSDAPLRRFGPAWSRVVVSRWAEVECRGALADLRASLGTTHGYDDAVGGWRLSTVHGGAQRSTAMPEGVWQRAMSPSHSAARAGQGWVDDHHRGNEEAKARTSGKSGERRLAWVHGRVARGEGPSQT